MAFIPVLSVAQCEMRFLAQGQRIENTLYFEHTTTGIVQADLDELTAWLAEEWSIAWKPIQSINLTHQEVYATDLTTADGIFSVNTDQQGVAGTHAAEISPGNVTLAVSFRTNQRGRSGRGRNYWCGLCEDQTEGNSIATVTQGQILAAYQRLIDDPLDGWTWRVVSRYHDGAARAAGLSLLITQVQLVDGFVDSQRRRLSGRGS